MRRCFRPRLHRYHGDLPHAELLVIRLGIGATLAGHGTQQLFGWFGGGGVEGTARGMEAMGFRPGRQAALMSGLSQAGGGALLALGLFTPLGGAAAAGAMAAAGATHLENGFFNMNGGWELPAVLGGTAAVLAVFGPGRYSLDRLLARAFGCRTNAPLTRLVCLAGGAAATAVVLVRRHDALAEDAAGAAEA